MKAFKNSIILSLLFLLNSNLNAQIVNSISINSDDPKGVLHVKQGIETGGCIECKELGIVLEDSDADDRWHIFNSGTSGAMIFWLFGANDNILTASAILNESGVWSGSDIRFKEKIGYLNHKKILPKIMQLKPAEYQFRNGHDLRPSLGFVAQDVEEILPAFVKTDDRGNRLLNYSYFSVLAIKGVQEVHHENQFLRKEVDMLQSRMEKLEKLLIDRQ